MVYEINPVYLKSEDNLKNYIDNFHTDGKMLFDGNRNKIKLFGFEDDLFVIKSFKIPNMFNRIVYKYFRKSKARRSYEYAHLLLDREINTPIPIAYFKRFDKIGLLESYYISEYIEVKHSFNEIMASSSYLDYGDLFKQFTQFTYKLHEEGIEFLDHTQGNTLIKEVAPNRFKFFLVDLNRMRFHKKMSLSLRIRNLRKFTSNIEIIGIISDEYARLSGERKATVFEALWKHICSFNIYYKRRIKIKNLLKR